LVPYNIAFNNLWRNDDQLRSFKKIIMEISKYSNTQKSMSLSY